MTKKLSTEEFIAMYKAALKAKMSRQEIGEYLEIQPESIIRRRLNILNTTGLDLPYLKNDPAYDGSVDLDKVDKFEEIYKELMEKHAGVQPTDVVSEKLNKRQVYVITSAQNATPVHEDFFATLMKYCELRNAQLMVIPYRYKNPTSLYADNEGDKWWPAIVPYLVDTKVQLCKGLQLVGEIKIQPTAVTPLSGFDAYTGSNSGIFGHPKVQLKTVATPSHSLPKVLTTTGACTVPNYTDSKAGHKGKFHHNISALVVEVDDDQFHVRHIHGENDGSFYDFEYYYNKHGRVLHDGVAGVVSGDTHAEFIDPEVEDAMFVDTFSMVNVLNPDMWIHHDVEDFYRRNHHHKNKDVLAYGKHHYGRNNVEEGLQITADYIDRHSRPNMMNVIVRANHDEAFDRWLEECNPKHDPENARFYYYMKLHQLSNVEMTKTGFSTFDAFAWWCENPLDQRGLISIENTRFLKRDEPLNVAGIEIGFHGDIGLNGGRGSLAAYSKIGPKCVVGHSHSPGIIEGAYQVGLSAYMDLEYKSGPSSWMHTHCIIYPNGSRALVNVVNGQWRASYYGKEHELASVEEMDNELSQTSGLRPWRELVDFAREQDGQCKVVDGEFFTTDEYVEGDWNRIAKIVKVVGFVQSADDFHQQPAVINGASDLFVDVFGIDVGQHARSAVGTNALPLNIATEVECIIELTE